jgi:MYXO-CTERM domain-containing protein
MQEMTSWVELLTALAMLAVALVPLVRRRRPKA